MQRRQVKVLPNRPFGGPEGKNFELLRGEPGVPLAAVEIRTGWYLDAIRLTWADQSWEVVGGSGGGEGGLELDWKNGERISKIHLRTGAYVDWVRFETNRGRHLEGGGQGGDPKTRTITAKGNLEIVGFYGSAGIYIDSLGALVEEAVPPIVGRVGGSGKP